MTATATQTATRQPRELARYDSDVGDRLIVGQRVDGIVQITDRPATGSGRSYLVEPHVTCMDELRALVDDYITKARKLDMARRRAGAGDDERLSRGRALLVVRASRFSPGSPGRPMPSLFRHLFGWDAPGGEIGAAGCGSLQTAAVLRSQRPPVYQKPEHGRQIPTICRIF